MMKNSKKYRIFGIAFLFAIWYLLASITHNEFLLPYPHTVLIHIFKLLFTSAFYFSLGSTLIRGFAAFACAILLASLSGILFVRFRHFKDFIMPLIVTLRSTPVVAVILLIIIWFKPPLVAFIVGLITMFPILTTAIFDGIEQTDKKLIEMAKLYRLSNRTIITSIQLPSLLPWLFNGASTALGFGWRAIVIGEVLSQPRFGIGSMMKSAQSYLLISELFVWTLIAIMIGYFFEWLVQKLKSIMIKWN